MTAPTGVCWCGLATAETDRTGRAAHAACIASIVATVADQSAPYNDFRGVAGWMAAHPPVDGGCGR